MNFIKINGILTKVGDNLFNWNLLCLQTLQFSNPLSSLIVLLKVKAGLKMILIKIGTAKKWETIFKYAKGYIVQQSDRIRTKCYEINGNVKL